MHEEKGESRNGNAERICSDSRCGLYDRDEMVAARLDTGSGKRDASTAISGTHLLGSERCFAARIEARAEEGQQAGKWLKQERDGGAYADPQSINQLPLKQNYPCNKCGRWLTKLRFIGHWKGIGNSCADRRDKTTRLRAPHGIPSRLRSSILSCDGFKCRYCGRCAPDVVLHVDHVVPVSQNGLTVESNLVAACEDCNLGKVIGFFLKERYNDLEPFRGSSPVDAKSKGIKNKEATV